MYVSTPPRPTSVAGAPAPSLLTINHLTLGPSDGPHVTEYPPRPAALRYLADMVTPYGVPYSEQTFLDGNHNSYAYLGERLLAEAGIAPELLLVAHATADCEPGRSLSGHLSTVCPGDPLLFAVSDQGDLSPFSALRILRQYVAAGWRRDAMLLILDQSTLPYPSGRPAGAERVDNAIGLAFGPGTDDGQTGPVLTAVEERFDVSPADLTGTLAELVDGLPATAGPVTVVATAAVLRHAELPSALAGGLRVARSGPRCVPPWATLATLVAEGVTGRIVLVEYDESLAGLAVAVFDGPAEPEALR
jgi:hypothetical protein